MNEASVVVQFGECYYLLVLCEARTDSLPFVSMFCCVAWRVKAPDQAFVRSSSVMIVCSQFGPGEICVRVNDLKRTGLA